jgi:prepilin-type N-terminal cleavage/methylation domain-containing protein
MKETLTQRIRSSAFTLVELMIVISIIAVLAAMIFPAFGGIKRKMHIKRAQAELQKLETAIQAYKTKYGHYPPDNRQANLTAGNRQYYGLNPLYYELKGTKLNGNSYQTLDSRITLATAAVPGVFGNGVSGFMNCTRGNSDESAPAQDFLKDLTTTHLILGKVGGTETAVLVCSVQWSKDLPPVMPDFTPDVPGIFPNPWRYDSSSPTNNPGEFDLWVDVIQGGKTNRISNWSTRPQVVYEP